MGIQIFVDGEPTGPEPSFMMRRGPAGQSIADGTIIDIDTLAESSGSDISYNSTTNVFTLKAGRKYKLTGALNFVDWSLSTGFANSRWRNVTSGALIGELGVAQNVASGSSNSGGQGIAVAVVVPLTETQVRLETLNVSGTGPTVGDASFGLPWAMVERL